jgi:hypothetical protein
MSADKDHLTDQLRQREKAQEDRYFEEQSRKQLEKLRQARAEATVAVDCPRCGAPLEERQEHGVAIDACTKGHGIWLDAGELEQITKREGDSWLSRLLLGSRK